MKITSLQNTAIKNIVKLKDKASERVSQGLFVIEGAREIRLAVEGGYKIRSLYHYPDHAKNYTHEFNYLKEVPEEKRFEITAEVYEKIAYRETTEGLIALAELKKNTLDSIHVGSNPLVVVLESVEKPGNLGAILRTADAADADAVIICDPKTDFYNSNVIRSSLGCVFTNQIAKCSPSDAIAWLRKNTIRTYAAELKGSVRYDTPDFRHASAIVLGTEADGLSDEWINAADARIKIPMLGRIDSLNVAASAAIIVFEAMRQRGFNTK